MKITTVTAAAFEGSTFRYALAPVQLIVGDNRSGKTSVLNAVRTAITGGTLPRLGKMDTRLLMSAAASSVAVHFDDGSRNTVDWTRDAKGSVSTKAAQAHRFPPVLTDFGEWVKLTEAGKVAAAFTAGYRGGDWDDGAVSDALTQIAVAAPVHVAGEAVAEVQQSWEDMVRTREEHGGDVPPWLEGTVAKLKDSAKEAAAKAKALRAQVLGYRDEAQGSHKDASAEVSAAKGQVSKRLAELGAARQRFIDAQRALENGKRASAQVLSLSAAEKALADAETALARAEKRAAGLPKPEPLDKLEDAQRAARDKRGNATVLRCKALEEIQKFERVAQRVLKSDKCPCCRSEGDWKERWQKAHDADVAAQRKAVAEADAEIVAAAKLEGDLAERRRVADGRTQALLDAQSDVAVASNDAKLALAQLKHLRAANVQDVSALEAAFASAKSDAEAADEAAGEAKLALADAEARQAAWSRWAGAKARLADAEAQATLAQAKADAYKAGAECVVEAQRKVLDAVFGRLLGTVNALTDGFMKPIQWRGDFGYERDGQWVSHKTFSGFEELLAYAGICVALAQGTPCKLVLLDELGRVSPENKRRLMARLAELVKAGTLDQALAVDVTDDWCERDGGKARKGGVSVIRV